MKQHQKAQRFFYLQFIYIFLLVILTTLSCSRTDSYVITLDAQKEGYLPAPVFVSFEDIRFDPAAEQIRLYRTGKGERTEVPVQLESGDKPGLWFISSPDEMEGESGQYRIVISDKLASTPDKARSDRDDKDITLSIDGKKVLSYRHATTEAPEGTDYLYRKSAYIHPLYTPEGHILTRIQPPDHYHHYGLWAPWTRVQVGNRIVNMWELTVGEGTVRFKELLSSTSGQVYCGFKVGQEHVAFSPEEEDLVVMDEILELRAFQLDYKGKPIWLIEYTTSLDKMVTDSVILLQYRYGGGIGFRATEEWTSANSTILTSEGKEHKDADATHARWCDIKGEIGDGISGISFFSHPLNNSHPEPMRVWPPDSTGHSDLFFEFCPIRHRSIVLEDNQDLVFRYRMLVYDGELPAEVIEDAWQKFASPVIVEPKLLQK